MIVLSIALNILGILLVIPGAMSALSGDRRAMFGWLALATVALCLAAVVAHDQLRAGFHAGVTAIVLWLWWNSGGGDGTRRRLRQWADRFHATRRTAPTAAMTASPLTNPDPTP